MGEEKGTQLFSHKPALKKSYVPFSSPPFLLGGISVVGGTAFVLDTAISHNLAIGGAGSDGSDGGNGGGGGVYNDASSSLRVERSTVTENHANGGDGGDGGSAGEGIGGGVYNLAVFNLDAFTVLNKNHASTSDDDIFGPFVLL